MSDDVGESLTPAWWEAKAGKQRTEAALACIDRIERAQEYRRLNDLMHASLYGNVEQFGFSPKSYGNRRAKAHARLSLNVVRNVVSTVVSKIAAKNKVRPKFLTSGADASVQRRAKAMENAIGGIFYANRFYKTQRRVFREVGVIGTGFVRPWYDERTRSVTIERVAPWDVLVDDEEAKDGNPHTLFYRRWYDKRVLAKMFPGKLEIIRQAGKRTPQDAIPTNEGQSTVDVVATYECFRRPSVPGAGDGVRVLLVDSGELGSEPWEYDYHPFPKLVWTDELEGFWGAGIAYELAGIQAEINDLLLEFARAHRLIKGAWVVEMASKVALKHINDDLGKIIRYAGVAPRYEQPIAIPQDTYRYLWDLYARAFEICGVSQLSATGQKPPGLNSGEAQRVYLDEQSERFLEVGTNIEDWTREVAEQCIDRARHLASKPGGYKVAARADGHREEYEWANIDLPKGTYDLEIFPTSLLPHTPAGRLAFVSDLVEMGIVADEGEALKLLGFPDLESFMARKNAPRELLDRNIESIVEKGTWVAPEPLDDHVLALTELPLAIAQARNKRVEPARISQLRRYVVLSARLQKMKLAGSIEGAVVEQDPSAGDPPPEPPPMDGAPPPAGPLPMDIAA